MILNSNFIQKAQICIGTIILLLSATVTCMAQEENYPSINVDYSKIENFVKNENSEFNNLVSRFEKGDSTLTLEELANVYYGSFFSNDYSYNDVSKELRESMKSGNYEKAYNLCLQELKKSPATLDLLYNAIVCSDQTNKDYSAYALRLNQILGLIVATGDGKTEETAFKIISIPDEYFIIYAVYEAKLKQQALVGNCDLMTIYWDDDPKNTKDIYFDITLHLSKLSALFGDFDSDSKADKESKKESKEKSKKSKKSKQK